MRMGIFRSDFCNIVCFSLPTYEGDVEVEEDERERADGDGVDDDEDEGTRFDFALLTNPFLFIYFFVNLWASLDTKCLLGFVRFHLGWVYLLVRCLFPEKN